MFFNVPSFAVGFAAGFGTGFLSRELARAGNLTIRPLTKAIIKGSMLAVERGKEALAIAGETFEDLIAEARSDIATEAPTTSKSTHATGIRATKARKKGHA